MRTLEMKISDAGPAGQRVDPHVLTRVRNRLVKEQRLSRVNNLWYRPNEPRARVDERLRVLEPIHTATNASDFPVRLGQTLEIAVLRSAVAAGLDILGCFLDLDDHDDSTLYHKEEPPLGFGGRRMPGAMRFDFLVRHNTAGWIGIECKNVREWIYPNRTEVRELLLKATTTDCLPCLVARRIPYVTYLLLETCGVLLFQTYSQLYPATDAGLAAQARDKDLLGYHDIRTGNDPPLHLTNFIRGPMMERAEEFRARFDTYKDLLAGFASGELSYAAFAARVRRRRNGAPEDSDAPSEEAEPDDWQDL